MKLKIIIAAIIAIAIAIIVIFSKDETIVDRPEQGSTIVAFGDSLVTGYGLATPDTGFVSLLSKRLGVEIINAGENGDTTATGLARVNDIVRHDPKMVIVLLGGNDALRRVPVEQTFSNLGKIIDSIHAQGAAVILVGVKGSLFGDKYDDEFKNLAREKQVNFVPNILSGLFGHPDLMTDQIHPNAAGHVIMADRIELVLVKLLK